MPKYKINQKALDRLNELSEQGHYINLDIDIAGLSLLEQTEEEPKQTLDLTKPLYATEEPEYDQEYWYVSESGVVSRTIYYDNSFDPEVFKHNNVFLTQEAAEKALEIMKAVQEFKRITREIGFVNYYNALMELYEDGAMSHTAYDQMSDRLDLVLLQHLV